MNPAVAVWLKRIVAVETITGGKPAWLPVTVEERDELRRAAMDSIGVEVTPESMLAIEQINGVRIVTVSQ